MTRGDTTVKKLIYLLILIIALSTLAACNPNPNPNSQNESAPDMENSVVPYIENPVVNDNPDTSAYKPLNLPQDAEFNLLEALSDNDGGQELVSQINISSLDRTITLSQPEEISSVYELFPKTWVERLDPSEMQNPATGGGCNIEIFYTDGTVAAIMVSGLLYFNEEATDAYIFGPSSQVTESDYMELWEKLSQ